MGISLILLQNKKDEKDPVFAKILNHFRSDYEDSDYENEDDDSSDSSDSEESEKTLLKAHSTLIVAPASLIYHWSNEILNRCKSGLLTIHVYHGPKREENVKRLVEHDVVITTYDLVRRSFAASGGGDAGKKKKKGSVLFEVDWRRVILDESHQIKNYKSAQSIAACALNSKSRWAMSGTPVQNTDTDLFTMLKFLHCEPFDNYRLWKREIGCLTTKARRRINTLVSCFVLRRLKD